MAPVVWPRREWDSSPSRWRSASPFRLLTADEAARRIAAGLRTALNRLPHDHGVLPHFVDSDTFEVYGADVCSTVETAWLAAGALWAAAFLRNSLVESLANRFYRPHRLAAPGAAPNGLLRHGKGADGRPLGCTWDRLNGETVFLYVLAVGADEGRALPPSCWQACGRLRARSAGCASAAPTWGCSSFSTAWTCWNCATAGRRPPVICGPTPRGPSRPTGGLPRRRRALQDLPALLGPVGRRRPRRAASPLCVPCLLPGRPYRRHRAPDRRCRVRRARCRGGPRESLPGRARPLPDGTRPLRVQQRQSGSELGRPRHGRHRRRRAVLALDNFLGGDRIRTVFHGVPCVAAGCSRLGFAPRRIAPRLAS